MIQIENVEQEIDGLESDVEDLKKKIFKLLNDCKRSKMSQKEGHKDYIRSMQKTNMDVLGGVKGILTTFEEAREDDD